MSSLASLSSEQLGYVAYSLLCTVAPPKGRVWPPRRWAAISEDSDGGAVIDDRIKDTHFGGQVCPYGESNGRDSRAARMLRMRAQIAC